VNESENGTMEPSSPLSPSPNDGEEHLSVQSSSSTPRTPGTPRAENAPLLRSTGDEFVVPWKTMSFSCGGWLQFYLYGVARAIQAAGLDADVQYCGCSAGALAAAGLAYEGDFDAAVEFCKTECIPKAHGHVSGLFKLADYVGRCIELLLVPKFKVLKPGALQVAITQVPFFTGVRVTEHPTVEELKVTLLASSAAYPGAPIVNHVRFGPCIDGGLSDFQPIVDAETITVSPFYFSDCDIRPSRYVPPWWALVPPKNTETVDWTYNLGFDDAMAYFAKRGIAPSPRARPELADFRRKRLHPFDTPRRINYHRFLGYDLLNLLPSQYLSFTLDVGLLAIFLLLLRPLALLAVYAELFVRVVVGSLLVVVSFGARGVATARQSTHCLMSLSLVLRFFSSFQRPSSAELRKHDQLYRCSVLYRILRHVI